MIEAPFLIIIIIILAIVTAVLAGYAWQARKQARLVEILPDAVLIIDRLGRITWANPAAESIFNSANTPLTGQAIMDLLPAIEPLLFNTPANELERIEVTLGQGKEPKIFDVKISLQEDKQQERAGWLVTLHDITRPKQMEEDLLSQKQRFERLLTVARATTERPTVEETLQNALDVTAAITAAEYGSLLLLDKDGVVQQGILALGKPVPGQDQIVRRVLDRGLAGWVVKNRQLALIQDIQQDERWLPAKNNSYVARSALAVPILSSNVVVGILTLTHSSPFHFRQEDAYLIEAAGEQMALAVRNAQLYDEQRALAGRQTTLYEVLRTVGGHLDPEAVAQAAVEVITRLTGWPAVAVLLPNGYETDLLVKGATGLLAGWSGRTVSTLEGITGRAFRLGEVQYVPEAGSEEDFHPWHPAISSQLAVPLRRGEGVLGILEIHSEKAHAFSQQDIQLAKSLAETIALALDNARFHAAMRKHAADLNALYAVNRMIGRSLEMEEMLAKSLYSALTSLGFGFGLIGLVDSSTNNLTVVAERSLPAEMIAQFEGDNLEGTFAAYLHRQKSALAVADFDRESKELQRLEQDLPEFIALLKQLNVRAFVGVPLDHQRNSLGVLCMFSRQPHQFSVNDLAVQITIGQQIAMAVSHSRLFRAVSDERGILQALIDSSRDGIVMMGAHRYILVVNQTALDFLQLPGLPEDWINQPLARALYVLRHHSPALVRGFIQEVRRMENEGSRPGGGEFELTSRSIRWQNLPVWAGNTLLGRLLVMRDVTDERTLNQVREDLVHTMVHDLRNPLTNIFGSLEFLDDEVGPTLSPEYQQVLEIAHGNAMHMVQMVNSILELNRLESGRMPLDQKPIYLPTLISNVIRTQSPMAKNKNLHLNYDVAADLPLAWADSRLIERVLQNLLDNAIKFTASGAEIHVKAGLEGDDNDWLLVSVSDSGPGIPADIRDRIFLKFTTARHQHSGTGLGLAFCKMAVEAHGGRIWLESQEGQGTTFYFTLPPLPTTGKKR